MFRWLKGYYVGVESPLLQGGRTKMRQVLCTAELALPTMPTAHKSHLNRACYLDRGPVKGYCFVLFISENLVVLRELFPPKP